LTEPPELSDFVEAVKRTLDESRPANRGEEREAVEVERRLRERRLIKAAEVLGDIMMVE
jgi:hypothetical protein